MQSGLSNLVTTAFERVRIHLSTLVAFLSARNSDLRIDAVHCLQPAELTIKTHLVTYHFEVFLKSGLRGEALAVAWVRSGALIS